MDALGNVTTYTYNGVGSLTSITEDDGRTTTYQYDSMGRVVCMEYPYGWVEEHEYDSIGHLLRVTDIDPSAKERSLVKLKFLMQKVNLQRRYYGSWQINEKGTNNCAYYSDTVLCFQIPIQKHIR